MNMIRHDSGLVNGHIGKVTLDIYQSLQCDVSESVKLIRFAENALFIVSTNGDEIIVRGGVVEGG